MKTREGENGCKGCFWMEPNTIGQERSVFAAGSQQKKYGGM